jgi:RHS repeat-associated protein
VGGFSPYQYTGQELDAESALYNYGARYYDSIVGKFVSIDPVPSDQYLSDPQQQNRFAYARGNPIQYVDPDGRKIVLVNSGEHQKRVLEELQSFFGDHAVVTTAIDTEHTLVSLRNVQGDLSLGQRVAQQAIESPIRVGLFFLSENPEFAASSQKKLGPFTARLTLWSELCKGCQSELYIQDATFENGHLRNHPSISVHWLLARELFLLWTRVKSSESVQEASPFFQAEFRDVLADEIADRSFPENPSVAKPKKWENKGDERRYDRLLKYTLRLIEKSETSGPGVEKVQER